MQISLSRYIYGIRILNDIHVGLYTYIPLSSPRLGAELLPRAILNPNDFRRCQLALDAGDGTAREDFMKLSKVG